MEHTKKQATACHGRQTNGSMNLQDRPGQETEDLPKNDQTTKNNDQAVALLLQEAKRCGSIQDHGKAIRLMLLRQRILGASKQNESYEHDAFVALLTGRLCERKAENAEAMQQYRDAFALYQEERQDCVILGKVGKEREIVSKMRYCLRLLHNLCQTDNDVKAAAKLGEIIASLEKQESILESTIYAAAEREKAQNDNQEEALSPRDLERRPVFTLETPSNNGWRQRRESFGVRRRSMRPREPDDDADTRISIDSEQSAESYWQDMHHGSDDIDEICNYLTNPCVRAADWSSDVLGRFCNFLGSIFGNQLSKAFYKVDDATPVLCI
jgi:IS5 family transposase